MGSPPKAGCRSPCSPSRPAAAPPNCSSCWRAQYGRLDHAARLWTETAAQGGTRTLEPEWTGTGGTRIGREVPQIGPDVSSLGRVSHLREPDRAEQQGSWTQSPAFNGFSYFAELGISKSRLASPYHFVGEAELGSLISDFSDRSGQPWQPGFGSSWGSSFNGSVENWEARKPWSPLSR